MCIYGCILIFPYDYCKVYLYCHIIIERNRNLLQIFITHCRTNKLIESTNKMS